MDPGQARRLSNQNWVATEKLHGANVSFVISLDGIEIHKRKGPIGADEMFYRVRDILERYREGLTELGQEMLDDEVSSVTLFGELFGGGYPHPKVAAVEGVQPVQTGVWYTPGIEFLAFDLARDDGQRRTFLDFDDFQTRCLEHGLPVVESLARGKLDAMMELPLGFRSTIPALFGLPALDVPNKAEGVVLRTVRETLLPTAKGVARAVLKRKIPEFAEDERYHQAKKWEQKFFQPDLNRVEYIAITRLNRNRIQSARSKLGPESEVASLAKEVCEDIWEELITEGLLSGLSISDRELLKECLRESAENEVLSGF